MPAQSGRSITFISRRPPYGRDNAMIGLDLVLASSVFDQKVNYLFVADGVYQLLPGQDTRGIAGKNLLKPLQALAIYGVENVFVDDESLAERGLTVADLAIEVQSLKAPQMKSLVRDSDLVFNL